MMDLASLLLLGAEIWLPGGIWGKEYGSSEEEWKWSWPILMHCHRALKDPGTP